MTDAERPSGFGGIYVAFHDKLSGLYAGFGAFITRHTLFTCLGGLLIFGCLIIGLVAVQKETNLEKLWIQTGTRVTPEKDFYEKWFGGLIRKENIAVTPNGGSILTKTNLASWKAVLMPILTESESVSTTPSLTAIGLNSVVNANQIVLNSKIGRTSSAKYTQKDFCEFPPVPALWQAGSPVAAAYANYTWCMSLALAPFGLNLPILPADWAIDRFPCTRTVVLDCFQDGNFDYPLRLKQLDTVALTLAGVAGGVSPLLGMGTTLSNTCISGYLGRLLAAGVPAASVSQIQSGMSTTIQAFSSFGYLWRKAISSFTATDGSDISTHMWNAITNTRSTLTLTQIIGLKKPTCLTWSGAKVGEQLYGGGVVTDDTAMTATLGATRMVANNYNADHPVFINQIARGTTGIQSGLSSDRLDLCKLWETQWQNYLLPMWSRSTDSGFGSGESYAGLRLYFAPWRATDDTIQEGSSTEEGLIIGGYIIIIVWSCIVTGKLSWPCTIVNSVYSHVGLTLWGVFAVALATMASFGMMGIIGQALSPISINLVPFLTLGIGINDMYVVVHSAIFYNEEKTVLNRMKKVLGAVGPAVLLTTLCNVVSFFIASTTPMRVVSSFAIQMGFALLFNHLTLFLVFCPGLAWDLRRSMLKRADLCTPPCVSVDVDIPAEDDPSISRGGNFITNFTRDYFAPACTLWYVKVIILCICYGFTIATIWNGATNLKKGLLLSDIALRGTFVREYTDIQEIYFGAYDAYYVTRTIDYTNAEVQTRFINTLTGLDGSVWRLKAMLVTENSWFTGSFLPFYNQNFNTSVPVNQRSTTIIPAPNYYTAFKTYITTLGATRVPDIACAYQATGALKGCNTFDVTTDVIVASKSVIYNRDLFTDASNFISAINDNRGIADADSQGDGFMFGFIYQFYQQYIEIDTNLYKVVGYSLIGVFCVAVAFTFSPIASALMCLVILQVVVQLWGFLSWIDVKLNAFSVVNLSMIVGVCVGFTGYVCHSFVIAHGTRNARMMFAMEEMMAPMVSSAMSTFLAVLVLVGARFPFFRNYYFAMYSLQTLIAIINGMVVFPVLLSLLGPRSMHHKKGEDSQYGAESGLAMKRIDTNDASSANILSVNN